MEDVIKILAIKKLKAIGMYSLVTTSGEVTVSDDIIVEFKLAKDMELTNKEYKLIMKENDKRNIYYKVCNYISYGMRSEYEIYHYLDEKGIKRSDSQKIVEELKASKMIDDNILAGFILDNVIRNKKGPKVFENKIFERKVKVNLDDYPYSEEKESEVIDEVISKLYDKKKELPVKKQKEYLYQKMMRDGFSSNIVMKKINEINFIDESLDSLDKEINKLNKKYEKLPSDEKKMKIIRSLLQKGYEYSDITKVVK